jgi:hypothetical protein
MSVSRLNGGLVTVRRLFPPTCSFGTQPFDEMLTVISVVAVAFRRALPDPVEVTVRLVVAVVVFRLWAVPALVIKIREPAVTV